MELVPIVFLVIIAIIIYFIRIEGHEGKIHSEIESMGGKVISIEKRNFFSGIGPFTVVGKNRMVYRIDYQINGSQKEGWVRFGGLFGPDWRL